MIEETISHYKILEKLGEGGMGVVYKAQDTRLDRTAALKFLPTQFSLKEQEKKRFIHEAKAAAALDHPNICTVYDIGETEDGQMYMVMPCYEGQNLKDKIASRPSPINEAIDIAIQIAEGLNKAHKKNIVHRDIKSANIFITDEGVVKILDFGVAKLKGQTKLTKENSTLGTIEYMSPEQAEGSKVDHRTDIWSLGVVLYEMITGQLPFKGDYEQSIVYSIMNEQLKPPTALRTGVPMELEQIVNKSLAKEPAERYQHVDDLLVDLKKVKTDSQPGITPARKKTKPEITIRASRKLMGLAILILLVIVIIAGYFIFKGKPKLELPPIEPGKKPSLAIVYFENKSGDKNLDSWRDAFSELLTIDLCQSRYIKVLRSDEVYSIFDKLNLLEAKRYTTQDLKEIAKNGRVNHILKGSYIKAGDNFVITAMLINASSGETVSSLSVKAEGEKDIFPKVDELTRKIKSKLKLTSDQITNDIDLGIDKITTSSPEAFEYYAQGRKYFDAGDHRKSIELMEKAVTVDPEFSMAYRSMAWSYRNMAYISEFKKYLQKAMELSQQLPDRERYYVQASFYGASEKTWDKSIEAYKKLLQLYPLDKFANLGLAKIYENIEEWDKAIDRCEIGVRNKWESHFFYTSLNYYYQAKGMYGKAREILEYYLKNIKDHYGIQTRLAANYSIQRKFDLALAAVEKAVSMAPHLPRAHYAKGDIYIFKGDLNNAKKTFRKLLGAEEKSTQSFASVYIGGTYIIQGRLADAETELKMALEIAKECKMIWFQIALHNYIGYISLISGKYEECLKELNEGLVNAQELKEPRFQLFGRFFTAITYLEIKSPAQAQKAESELLEWVNNRMNKKQIRWYYLFQGQKEMKNKKFAKAIEYFNKAVSLLSYQKLNDNWLTLFFDPLARAYYESGNLEKAQEEYEKITTLTQGRWATGDLYARAFYQLGKIYEQKGFKGKTIDSYSKFITLWKDCDPQFQPLVEDARKQVKLLEGNQ